MRSLPKDYARVLESTIESKAKQTNSALQCIDLVLRCNELRFPIFDLPLLFPLLVDLVFNIFGRFLICTYLHITASYIFEQLSLFLVASS